MDSKAGSKDGMLMEQEAVGTCWGKRGTRQNALVGDALSEEHRRICERL